MIHVRVVRVVPVVITRVSMVTVIATLATLVTVTSFLKTFVFLFVVFLGGDMAQVGVRDKQCVLSDWIKRKRNERKRHSGLSQVKLRVDLL